MAAENGDVIAQFHLGIKHALGPKIETNESDAVELFPSAAHGKRIPDFGLDMNIFQTDGVEQNYAEAEYWLRKAAERNHRMAQLNLGIMYLEYNTEEQSNWDWHSDKKTLHSKAEYWIAKAANGGSRQAQYLLGWIYLSYNASEENHIKAIHYLRKSANSGETLAQIKLGELYAEGEIVTQDYEETYYWFILASEYGDEDKFYLKKKQKKLLIDS